ncbi:MAG: glycosyltransferase [Gemmatimonadota bacterium]|nr:glycosyltransferase [Gemmatimonadota bacterium]
MSDGPAHSIAVVIPAHDAERLIADALDSVWIQTRRPDECLVVDDGSSDRTASVVAAWASEHDLPVRILEQANLGAAAARSAGVEAARTDLVSLLDADDVLLPEALDILERGFQAWPDLAVCFGNAERWTLDGVSGSDYLAGKPVWRLPYESAAGRAGEDDDPELRRIVDGVFESLLGGSYIANCAALVRREAALEAGLWSDAFPTVEDRDFWLRLSRVGAFAYTPRPVAQVRYHERNLTTARGDADHALDGVRVLEKMVRLAPDLDLAEGERRAARTALSHAVEGALYAGAREGLPTYLRTVRELSGCGEPVRWTRPGLLARALVGGLIGSRRPPRARTRSP